MLILMAAIAVPANLVALVAIAYALRGRSRDAMLVYGLVGMLFAMATSSVTVISAVTLSHFVEETPSDGPESRAELQRQVDAELPVLVGIGIGSSLLPWIGALMALGRARKMDT